VRALSHAQLTSARFQQLPIIHGKGIIINDSYNANPESMKAAIAGLENIKIQATKIAVLGDMLELGIEAESWHRQIGRFLRKAPSIKEVALKKRSKQSHTCNSALQQKNVQF
jgi:UDP-N-acetylmuramoyl-tripeptide--D-alanyl-D-alanine ligase